MAFDFLPVSWYLTERGYGSSDKAVGLVSRLRDPGLSVWGCRGLGDCLEAPVYVGPSHLNGFHGGKPLSHLERCVALLQADPQFSQELVGMSTGCLSWYHKIQDCLLFVYTKCLLHKACATNNDGGDLSPWSELFLIFCC